MSIFELDQKVKTLRELQAEIDELTAEAEAIKEAIKEKMADEGTEVLEGNGWKATWRCVESNRFDSKALKAADPDTYAMYTITARTCRFTLN